MGSQISNLKFKFIKSGMSKSYIWWVFYTRIWGTSSLNMTLKFGKQVEEVKIGPRNFFEVRIFSGGFKMGLQRKKFTPGLWATGKTYKAEILQGASHHQYRTSEFYSAKLSIGWATIKIFQEKSGISYFLVKPLKKILIKRPLIIKVQPQL